MPDIADVAWSEHDERNSEAVPNGWPAGAFPAYTDQVGQMMMGATKRFWNKINPVYQTTGTGDNYVVQTEIGIDQINLYEILCIRIDRSNTTTTPTLQFGATNARTIVKAGPSGYVPLAAGDMFAGNSHTFWYNGAFYVLTDPALIVGATVQPYSPNLTSWAAITRATGFDTWVASPTSANLAALVGDETGTGALVFANSPALVTPNLGTPSAAVLTNATGLPVSTGVSGLGTGVATALGVNVGTSGSFVANGGALGTPASGVATNLTGLPLTSGVTGILPIGNGGTNASAANSARLNLTLPVYTTYANLPSLDTTKDAVAILTDRTREGQWVWNSGDQSARTVIQTETTTSISGNVITLANHGLSTGAGIVTTTAVNGLSVNTVYWVINLSSSTFSLATTVENAIAGTVLTLTGTTNFTIKQLRDPLQDIYVPASGGQLDGTTGVWSARQGENDYSIGRANYQRFNDRLLIGQGATRWMGEHSVTTAGSAAGSWLLDETTPSSTFNMGYLLLNAQVASINNPVSGFASYSLVGAARSLAGADSQGYIGAAGYAAGHATSGSGVIWGGYFQADKRPGANNTAQGVEIEIANMNTTPTTPVVTPAATYVQGRTFGIFLASGASFNAADLADADSAIFIGNNNAKFRTGLTFFSGALTQDATTNYQHAILLPTKARLEWYTSDGLGNYAFTIHSEVSTLANSQYWRILDGEVRMLNNNGGIYGRWLANTSGAGNYIYLQAANAGASPTYAVEGGDTNINLTLTPKGAAVVIIGTALSRGNPVTKTANFTLGNSENWVIVNQAATTTVTLPAASGFPGREVEFRTIQAQTLVSASSNVVPLAGGAAGTAILAATAGKWATLVSDGTNWQIMAGN